MDDVWDTIAEIALELHPRRMAAIADKLRSLESVGQFMQIKSSLGPKVDADLVDGLEAAWRKAPDITPNELAAAFFAASRTASSAGTRGAVDLVWTGPSTGLVPVRHTEQALCEVIDSARYTLFLVSFVAYEVPSISKALRTAVGRQVRIDVLLESSTTHGGMVSVDSFKQIKGTVPSANVFAWKAESIGVGSGASKRSVHAKCAVADGTLAFVTSANLSSAAMERNMELGVLVRGGPLPDNLHRHLEALAAKGIVERV